MRKANFLPVETFGVLADEKCGDRTYEEMGAIFELERQQKENWCWAAVAKGVLDWFVADHGLSQCKIASLSLGRECCDPSLGSSECDKPISLDIPLSVLDLLDKVRGVQSFKRLEERIERLEPICLRVQWRGFARDGHFVLVVGTSETQNGTKLITICDPSEGNSTILYDDILDNYLGYGRWTDTYYVQKPEDYAATYFASSTNNVDETGAG